MSDKVGREGVVKRSCKEELEKKGRREHVKRGGEEERRGEEVLRNEKGESNGRRGGAYVPVVVSVHPDDK
jgi:hypothetical protein